MYKSPKIQIRSGWLYPQIDGGRSVGVVVYFVRWWGSARGTPSSSPIPLTRVRVMVEVAEGGGGGTRVLSAGLGFAVGGARGWGLQSAARGQWSLQAAEHDGGVSSIAAWQWCRLSFGPHGEGLQQRATGAGLVMDNRAVADFI
ncbi:hypothetical protein OROHE_026602 [Orobanche hederae]